MSQYSDFGVIQHFLPANQQSQQLFVVIDYKGEPVTLNRSASTIYG
jgi:hypothetical protein